MMDKFHGNFILKFFSYMLILFVFFFLTVILSHICRVIFEEPLKYNELTLIYVLILVWSDLLFLRKTKIHYFEIKSKIIIPVCKFSFYCLIVLCLVVLFFSVFWFYTVFKKKIIRFITSVRLTKTRKISQNFF